MSSTPKESSGEAPGGEEPAEPTPMARIAEQIAQIRTSIKELDALRDQVTEMTVQAMYDEEAGRRLLRVAKRMQSPQVAAQEYALRDMAERLRGLWAPDRNDIDTQAQETPPTPHKRRNRSVKRLA